MRDLRYSLFTFMLAFAAVASGEVDCTGKIERLGVSIEKGVVTVGLSSGPNSTQLCAVAGDSPMNKISNSVCRTLYSTLIDAKSANREITIRFYEHDSCNAPALADRPSGPLVWYAQYETVEQKK